MLSSLAKATHIVGGEIYYDYLGGNNYKISMKVYRDAINGVPPFDNPAIITIFDVNGNIVTTLSVALLTNITVPPSNNSPCAPAVNGSVGVEEAFYETTVNLPPLFGGYFLAYQRCCRNSTILNLVNPGAVGTTYWEHIPGPEVAVINSSPRFSNRPPIYICNNIPIAFDHVATDPDGDVLVYSLCNPFNGLDGCCPFVDGTQYSPNTNSPQCFNPPTICPAFNSAPPYQSVPFLSPYTSSYPMASNPAININANTGFLNGNPTTLGQWVVGVCVSEYRNGVLIGTHHRDFQFNVINCPFIANPSILQQTSSFNNPQIGQSSTGFCNGYTVNFSNQSTGGIFNTFWDFGDPTTLSDTSISYNPSYTFPATGNYTVTLIINKNLPCTFSTTSVFHAAPLLSPNFIYPTSQCFNNNSFNFQGSGNYQSQATFSWNFGAQATPSIALTPTVNNVHFNAPGTYSVGFTVSENQCTATKTNTLQVFANPVASIGNYITSGCNPLTVSFANTSTSGTPMTYLWSFSDGSTSTSISPTQTFTQPGVYSVSLTVSTSQQCIDTKSVTGVSTITVSNVPTALFNFTSATGACLLNNSLNFNNTSTTLGAATYSWAFGATATPSVSSAFNVNNVQYATQGIKTITLNVNEGGCVNATTQTVTLYDNPKALIGPFNGKGCSPYSITFANASNISASMTYTWNFSDGSTSNDLNPTITFSNEGVYTASLSVSTASGCVGASNITAVNSITIIQTPVAVFSNSSLTGYCFNNNRFTFYNNSVFTGTVSHQWLFGSNALPQTSSALSVSSVVYNQPGFYNVTLIENKNGCADTATSNIEIYPNPEAHIKPITAIGCDPLTVNYTSQSIAGTPLTYLWMFSDGTTSTLANPTHVFSPQGVYSASLQVTTNAKCVGTSKDAAINSATVVIAPTAGFNLLTDNQTFVNLTNTASFDVTAWYYDFGDGNFTTTINPSHVFSSVNYFTIIQTVTNTYGCSDTAQQTILFIPDFGFWIPNAFTPNKKDGINDVFKPVIYGVEQYEFLIFNRWGQQIFSTNDINEGWDGTFKKELSPLDVYVWKCSFTNKISGKEENHVGHVTLVR